MMILMREDWNLKQWHDFLDEEMDLQIGKDWHWAWQDNNWAIEFSNPVVETAVRLKANIA